MPAPCKDNLLGIRNTFFDLSDSPPLKQWYADIRRVRSCPASEYGDDDQCDYEDDACKDDGSDLLNTPEPSPRPREPSKPWPTAGSYVKKPAASRTALKSGATPYRPAPAPVPACSTTYYAVPPAPTISTPGQGPLAAEYHSRVQASRVQFAQAQVQQNSLMTQHYPVPVGNVKARTHFDVLVSDVPKHAVRSLAKWQEGPPILGSEALPSDLGSCSRFSLLCPRRDYSRC